MEMLDEGVRFMKNDPLMRILWKVKSRETCWKMGGEKGKVTEEPRVSSKK